MMALSPAEGGPRWQPASEAPDGDVSAHTWRTVGAEPMFVALLGSLRRVPCPEVPIDLGGARMGTQKAGAQPT
jgi:hypothetical protein